MFTVYELYIFIYSPNLSQKKCLLYMNCICLYTVQTYHKKIFTVYELYMFIYSPNLSQKNVYCI